LGYVVPLLPSLGRNLESREGIPDTRKRVLPGPGEPGVSVAPVCSRADQAPPFSFAPPQRMVSAGYLGKKSGRGFYSYDATPAPPPPRKPGVEDPTDSPAPYGNAEGDVDVGLRRMGDKE
jgi:hypothetical protein